MFKFSPGALGAVSRKPPGSASEKWASGRHLWVRGDSGRNEGCVSHVGTWPIRSQGKSMRSRRKHELFLLCSQSATYQRLWGRWL